MILIIMYLAGAKNTDRPHVGLKPWAAIVAVGRPSKMIF
jgi:hypothetical protein